jgi:hypothetical protein
MSKIKSYKYYIEYKDGSDETMNYFKLKSEIDNIFDTISKIVKQYRLHNNSKKVYNMTLYTDEYTILAKDYIKHYSELPEYAYGADLIDDFDIELINMFN